MKFDWKYLSTMEPAVLRGVWVAIVGVLTAFGLQVSDTTHAKATAIIAALAILVPLIQAFWTRAAVSPVAKLQELQNAVTTPAPAPTGPTITTGGGNVSVSLPQQPATWVAPTGPTVPVTDDPGAVVQTPPEEPQLGPESMMKKPEEGS